MAAVLQSKIQGLINIDAVAHNDNNTRLAACSRDGTVHICERVDAPQMWQATSELPVQDEVNVTQIAWAHSEHGSVIACAKADGLVNIWQQAQAGAGQQGQWQLRSILKESMKPITCLQFAPRQLSPMLAAASQDSTIRLYQASAPLNADRWQLCSDLKASTSCHCLSWRQYSQSLPPMLCVGTSQGAQIWYYRSNLGDWAKAASLDTGNAAVSSIDWAPALGRPVELIAAATESGAFIWSFKGKTHDLQVQQMLAKMSDEDAAQDCLPIQGQVWKVQFDKMGILLATSATDGDQSSISIWEQNPQGHWYLLSKIVGDASEDNSGNMLE